MVWIFDPFVNSPGDYCMSVQEFVKPLEDAIGVGLKITFDTLPVFWVKVTVKYSKIATIAIKSQLPFPTSCMCESGFLQ